jgi:catechol 2,3-dioxygenase-like lactoylglutathione lyase family enzyme
MDIEPLVGKIKFSCRRRKSNLLPNGPIPRRGRGTLNQPGALRVWILPTTLARKEQIMIDYATLGTNNLARAQEFYDALLAEIGAKRLMELPQGFTMYGVRLDRPALAITPPYDGKEARPGNGNMLALVLNERAKVDALHKRALQLGGSDEGAPGVRGEEGPQAFYAAYFRNPEGNKLCAYRVGPA